MNKTNSEVAAIVVGDQGDLTSCKSCESLSRNKFVFYSPHRCWYSSSFSSPSGDVVIVMVLSLLAAQNRLGWFGLVKQI